MNQKTINLPVKDFDRIQETWYGLESLAELFQKSEKLNAVGDVLWPIARQLGEVVLRYQDELREARKE